MGWVLLVIEALVAAPLWIIGHAMPDGEGFSGDHGKQGYLLILGILVRPFLMLIALCLSIIVIEGVARLVAQILSTEDHLSHIRTLVNHEAHKHCLGFMQWDSLTQNFEYSNLGL